MTSELTPPSEFEPKSHLKRNLAILLVCIMVIISAAVILLKPGGLPGELLGGGIYSNPEWGFEVQVPSGWEMREHEQDITILRPEDNSYIFVGYYAKSQSSLQEWGETWKSAWGITASSERSRMVSGVQAWEIIGTTYEGKFKVVLLRGNEWSYAIHCAAKPIDKYDQLDPTFEAIIQSFKLI